MGVIHERLLDQPGTEARDHFAVSMKGNSHVETDSLEDVLGLENSRKHKIERLVITSSTTRPGTTEASEVQVDFGMPKGKGKPTDPKVIAVNVKGPNVSWNNKTLSEVEEQVERTELRFTPAITTLLLLFGFVLVLLLTQFVRFDAGDLSRSAWLDDGALDRIEKAVKENRTLTEDELREIQTMQWRNVFLFNRPPKPPKTTLTRRLILIGGPMVVVMVLVFILILSCYPRAVFLWGDEVESYENLRQRRRLIWGIITGVMVIGVTGKFLSEGFLSWVPKE
jgi:hypothetical protein